MYIDSHPIIYPETPRQPFEKLCRDSAVFEKNLVQLSPIPPMHFDFTLSTLKDPRCNNNPYNLSIKLLGWLHYSSTTPFIPSPLLFDLFSLFRIPNRLNLFRTVPDLPEEAVLGLSSSSRPPPLLVATDPSSEAGASDSVSADEEGAEEFPPLVFGRGVLGGLFRKARLRRDPRE